MPQLAWLIVFLFLFQFLNAEQFKYYAVLRLPLTCFDLRYYFKCFPNHSGPSLKRRPMGNGTSGFVGVSSREGDIKCEYQAGGGGGGDLSWGWSYTEYAGWAVTAGIPVKFCSAHGRLTLVVGSGFPIEVGSGFPIEAYGRGVSRPSLVIENSNQNISAITDLLSPKQNFFSLTVCWLDQYLLNSSENTVLLP